MTWLTTAQAAEQLGASQLQVQRWLKAGRLKGQLMSARLWLVSAASVAGFVKRPRGRPRKRTG